MLSQKKEENIYGSGLREMNLIFRYPRKMANVTVAFLLTGGGKFTGDGGCGLVAKSYPTLVTPWTVAHQAPLPIEFSRHQYWSRLPFPSPGDLLDPGIKPGSPVLQADSLPTELGEKTYSQGLYFCLATPNFLWFQWFSCADHCQVQPGGNFRGLTVRPHLWMCWLGMRAL